MVDINVTLLWQFINFIILYLALRRFLFRPVRSFLREREERIAGELERAEREEEAARRLKAKREKRLQEAQSEAREIVEAAQRRAEEEKKEILAAADREADRIRREAELEAEREQERARKVLYDEMIDVSTKAAEKILDRELSADGSDGHEELISAAIAAVEETEL